MHILNYFNKNAEVRITEFQYQTKKSMELNNVN